MSVNSILFNVSFKACVSLFIFILDYLSIGESGVLKSPLWLCYCRFPLLWLLAFALFIEVLLCWVHQYLHLLYLLLYWSLDHYVGSFFVSCNRLYFKVYFVWYEYWYSRFPFAWNIFFHPLTFSLYVYLGLKWVACRQHIHGSCFCIHSAILCPLVGAFNPLTFKVIINMYVSITIFLIIFCRSFPSLVFPA